MLSAVLIASLLEGAAATEPSVILERARRARAAWVESCTESRYELCAELGRRSRSMIQAECVYRLPVSRSPPPELCGGWIGNHASADRRVRRNPRRRKPARRALAQLEAVLAALDAQGAAQQDEARSIAVLTLVDDRFERWLELDPPRSIEAIGDYLRRVEAGATALAEAYGEVVALGDPYWATAAWSRVALVHQVAIQRADWLPIPRPLRHRGRWHDNEFCRAVDDASWEWTPPLWSRVHSSYRLCAAAIREHKQVGPIAVACEVEGAMLGIKELTPPAELFDFRATTTAPVVAVPVVLEP